MINCAGKRSDLEQAFTVEFRQHSSLLHFHSHSPFSFSVIIPSSAKFNSHCVSSVHYFQLTFSLHSMSLDLAMLALSVFISLAHLNFEDSFASSSYLMSSSGFSLQICFQSYYFYFGFQIQSYCHYSLIAMSYIQDHFQPSQMSQKFGPMSNQLHSIFS